MAVLLGDFWRFSRVTIIGGWIIDKNIAQNGLREPIKATEPQKSKRDFINFIYKFPWEKETSDQYKI